jgi:hypothetical protein
MARKKEGFRRGSSANPEDQSRDMLTKRGAGRAPSTDSKSDPEKSAKDKREEVKKGRSSDGKGGEVKEERLNSDYNTVMDDILALIDGQESVSLTELSAKFNVPYARLEEWGRILDKDGLLELEYPMVGDVMLRKKGYSEMMKSRNDKKKGKDKKEEKKDGKKGDDKKEGEKKAEENKGDKVEAKPGEAKKEAAVDDAEKKRRSKKRFMLIMFGFIFVIIALVAALIYSLSKGGYIKLV